MWASSGLNSEGSPSTSSSLCGFFWGVRGGAEPRIRVLSSMTVCCHPRSGEFLSHQNVPSCLLDNPAGRCGDKRKQGKQVSQLGGAGSAGPSGGPALQAGSSFALAMQHSGERRGSPQERQAGTWSLCNTASHPAQAGTPSLGLQPPPARRCNPLPPRAHHTDWEKSGGGKEVGKTNGSWGEKTGEAKTSHILFP